MTVNTKKGGKDVGLATGLAVGAGLIAAAGGYFLYGPNGKSNRKKVRAWGIKARGEVLHEIERMKDVTADGYVQAVDKVMAKYEKMKDISGPEIDELKGELKRYWKRIVADVKSKTGQTKKTGAKKKIVTKKSK
ncbi:MAG: hypothetical protein AAB821_01675 [Patescibacteria group bacterium]